MAMAAMAPSPAVVLQVCHQVKAARLVQHFQDEFTRPKLFPENFATEVRLGQASGQQQLLLTI